jgi:hypothetical protein
LASQPIPPLVDTGSVEPEQQLTREEAWNHMFSLYGSAREMFAEVGGSEAWIRFLRDEEDEDQTEISQA